MISDKIDKLRRKWLDFFYFKKRKFIFLFRYLTSPLRMFPDFIIIGGPRCGSTSLYKNLIEDPFIGSSLRKEIKFFDSFYNKGYNWYRAFFPLKILKLVNKYIFRHEFITGEASPFYIFESNVPKRIYSILPNVKLIIILRNPVNRAYSHFRNFEWRLKTKGLDYISFKDAIKLEKNLLKGKKVDFFQEKTNYPNSVIKMMKNRFFLARGIYVDQIKKWNKYYPKEQILILRSEDFNENPNKVLKQIYKFLNFPCCNLLDHQRYNVRKYPKIDDEVRKELIEFFKPHNQRLYEYIGRDFNWDK